MVREVNAEELFESQSIEHLRVVLREVTILCLDEDRFFDGVRSAYPIRYVRREDGRFYFRFDPRHRGRPDRGQMHAFDLFKISLTRLGRDTVTVDVRVPVNPESMLQAFRDMLVQEVMDL